MELSRLCQSRLGWKRTTTYTVIKRLRERGVLKNENWLVTSLISRQMAKAGEITSAAQPFIYSGIPNWRCL